MGKVVCFPKSLWTEDRIKRDDLYKVHNDTNPLFVLWRYFYLAEKKFSDGDKVPNKYLEGAICILRKYGDMRDRDDFMSLAVNTLVDKQANESEKIRLGNTRKPRGRMRITDPSRIVHRSASFEKQNPDGSYTIADRKFANQYQYRKYRKYLNKQRTDGTIYIEGIDFYLTDDGYVVEL